MTMTDKCPFCDGTGYVKQDSMGITGYTMFSCNYCGGSGNNKYTKPIPTNTKKRCPFYEEEYYDGTLAESFCENPNIRVGDSFICPYGEEYDCDIPIHLRNLKRAV